MRRPIEYSESSGRAHQLMIRVTFWGFQYNHFCLGSPVELIRFHFQPPWIYIFFVSLFCFVDGYITTSYNCLLEVSDDDILSQVFVIMHKYIYIYIHTYPQKVSPTVYYSCHLVIPNYHKSYQQYFNILLNYTILEIYCYQKKKINK